MLDNKMLVKAALGIYKHYNTRAESTWSTNKVIFRAMRYNAYDQHTAFVKLLSDIQERGDCKEKLLKELRAVFVDLDSMNTSFNIAKEDVRGVCSLKAMLTLMEYCGVAYLAKSCCQKLELLIQGKEYFTSDDYIELNSILENMKNIRAFYNAGDADDLKILEAGAEHYDKDHDTGCADEPDPLYKLAEKAHPRPWKVDVTDHVRIYNYPFISPEINGTPVASLTGDGGKADAAYIVEACNRAPDLARDLDNAYSIIDDQRNYIDNLLVHIEHLERFQIEMAKND